jgi:hypothetical protein
MKEITLLMYAGYPLEIGKNHIIFSADIIIRLSCWEI